MKYDPFWHHRRSIRLKGYDYTQSGAYFVTICTHQRDEIFGQVVEGEMQLSVLGEIVREEWVRSAEIRKEIQIFDDEFSIMPNHLHGINWIIRADGVGADGVRPDDGLTPALYTNTMRPNVFARTQQDAHRASPRRTPRSLGSFIAGFKASVTSRARRELNMTGIWQRNYYDHIIRNDYELNNVRRYIANNALNWQLDRDNSRNIRKLSPPEKVEEYVKDVEVMVLKSKTGNS